MQNDHTYQVNLRDGEQYLIPLLKRADQGDEKALRKLREELAGRPDDFARLAGGDLPDWVRQMAPQTATRMSPLSRHAAMVQTAQVRRQLEGPDPTPLEKILAERAAVCWMLVHLYEIDYSTRGSMSVNVASYLQRRIDRANGRFLATVKTLATVRKLALPATPIQVRQEVTVNVPAREGAIVGTDPLRDDPADLSAMLAERGVN